MSKEQTFSKIIEKQYRDRQILRIHHIFTFCPRGYQEENMKIELALSNHKKQNVLKMTHGPRGSRGKP